jgi:hypothetical protein
VGEDVDEIKASVKRALMGCCQQLRVSLARSLAQKEEAERKKNLVKYIPDISRAVITVLEKMSAKQGHTGTSSSSSASSGSANTLPVSLKRTRIMRDVANGDLDEDVIAQKLTVAVERYEKDAALLAMESEGADKSKRVKLHLIPLSYKLDCLPPEYPTSSTASSYSASSSSSSLSSSSSSNSEVIYIDVDSIKPLPSSPPSASPSSRSLQPRSSTSKHTNTNAHTFTHTHIPSGSSSGKWVRLSSGINALIFIPKTLTKN